MFTVLFGSLSALIWGAGDFAGGIASRRIGPYRAVFYCEALGLLILSGAAIFFHEAPMSAQNLAFSIITGVSGGIGALILYTAMRRGKMSIAAPVSALFTAAIPIITETLIAGFPSLIKFSGFLVALLAIWMIAQSQENKSQRSRLSDLRLPLLAGLCFGLYFILLNQSTHHSWLSPLIVSHFVSTLTVMAFMLIQRRPWNVQRAVWPFIIFNAILDIGGNIFYILAGQHGRMDIAAVISSLYPGATVFLAWVILKEDLSTVQKLGMLTSLLAIALMTL